MKTTNVLQIIDVFLENYYPKSNGVLLFGSASFKKVNFQDIDLLVVDEKFSYISKIEVNFNHNRFSVIKVPADGLFNLLAEDFKKGVYKNIFETGFIIKDDLKFLTSIKQYIKKDYPDSGTLIAHHLNTCIFKINESIRALETKLPPIENFLIFSNCVSFLIDFIILQDRKINFTTSKHKSRYLHQYHPEEALAVNDLITVYKKNSKEAVREMKELMQQLNVPVTHGYSNDYLLESTEGIHSPVLYIPEFPGMDFYGQFCDELHQQNFRFYSYHVDENNIEKPGVYFVINVSETTEMHEIRERLNHSLKDQVFFFPYNLAFNQEIKFGGENNYAAVKDILTELQPKIHLAKQNNTCTGFILSVIRSMNISLEEAGLFYFYKTVNNSHSLPMEEIIEKEKKHKITMNENRHEAVLNEDKTIFSASGTAFFTNTPKYFLMQILDRILSMFLLNDTEKRQIIESLRNQNLVDV